MVTRAQLAEGRKRIEIFKAGRHTDMNGRTIDFSAGDLIAAAAAYDPALHEAPVVVGHPHTDDPAYGWVAGLSSPDGNLFADLAEVDADFAEMVRAGRFKKISASFYTPESSQNPAPGVYYLRHVGFLGAQPPAIKGLKPVAFAASEEGTIQFGLELYPDISFHEMTDRKRELKQQERELMKKGLALDRREEALKRALKDPATKGVLLDSAVAAFMESNPNASYREAILEVSKEHPEYFDALAAPEANTAAGERLDAEIQKFQEAQPGVSYGEALIEVGRQSSYYSYLKSPLPEKVNTDKLRDKEIARFQEAHPEASYTEAFIAVSKAFPQYFDI